MNIYIMCISIPSEVHVIQVTYSNLEVRPGFIFCTQDDRTALYQASKKGRLAAVQLLLQEHADVTICDEVICMCLLCQN